MTNYTEERTRLPATFVPSDNDVICSRGKLSENHPGNLAFDNIIESHVAKYAAAQGKLEKSIIVSNIIHAVRSKSPDGGFVKLIGGEWYEIGATNARERVSQAFRNKLSGLYRSSSSSKKKRKNEINAKINEDLEVFVESNEFVSKRMRTMSGFIETHGTALGDFQLAMMMDRMNTDILNQLKKDTFASFGVCTAR